MPVPSLSILALSDSLTAEAAKPIWTQLRCLPCDPVDHTPFTWRPRASAKRKLGELTVAIDVTANDVPIPPPLVLSVPIPPPLVLSDSHGKDTSKAYKPDDIKYQSESPSEFQPSSSLAELVHSLFQPRRAGCKRVLHLFSGEPNRPGSLGSAIRSMGHQCVEIDLIGGDWHDLLGTILRNAILRSIGERYWDAIFIGTPCNTFTVLRMHPDSGPRQLRSQTHHHGVPGLSETELMYVRHSDSFVALTVTVAELASANGTAWIVENPPHRGTGSERYQAKYQDHLSLFGLEAVAKLLEAPTSATVRFDQCAFGGNYQKWTQLVYSHKLKAELDHWKAFKCSHCYNGHLEVAQGSMSRASAAYAESMAWVLANVLLQRSTIGLPMKSAPKLRSGSARPHASDVEAQAAIEKAKPSGTASLRRLLPENESVLIAEPFPLVNLPVVAPWEEAPTESRPSPTPRSTDELIPRGIQEALLRHGVQVHACYDAATRGRWKWARDHRPQPLVASEEECFTPDTPKGWSWKKRKSQDLWDAIRPSVWPEDPPDFELNANAILAYATEHRFTDMQVISWMCNGYPGPDMPYHTVIGTPHVGALKSMEALMKCAAKDRKRGWGEYNSPLPPIWPVLCDPVNIVWRHGKPRMTIDKSMQLSTLYDAYNEHVQLQLEPSIEYVSPALAGRSTAILLTAGVSVRIWGFDVEAYFRKSGKQRTHWWKSGLLYWDGYGYDPRIQFGQREAPVRLGRQSTFLRFAIHKELARIDAAYPSRIGRILEWLALRSAHANAAGAERHTFAALFYIMLFVDDAAGGSIDDLLYDTVGAPVTTLVDGVVVHMTRATLHYQAALGMLTQFGHDEAQGKGVPPQMRRTFLGVTECVHSQMLYLTSEKKEAYRLECIAAKSGVTLTRAGGGVVVEYDHLNSLVHKLIHAASVHVLGRQHLWHTKAALRARNKIAGGGCILFQSALDELDWWIQRLDSSHEEGTPIAYRLGFPESGDPTLIDSYSDASRELKSPGSSGGGAWCIIAGVFYFIERRWTNHERETYSINVLEYAIMNMATFTFASEARRLGLPVSFVREHTDNSSAEHVAERGRPSTYEMHELTQHRYERLSREGLFSATTRITSIDNDVADWLSRGGQKLMAAIKLAARAGLSVRRLAIDPSEDNLQAMLRGKSHSGLLGRSV